MSPDARVTELHPADPVSGLPERGELGVRTRAVVEASALADIGLRTLAASMVTASMVPMALSRKRLRAERDALGVLRRAHRRPRRDAVVPRARRAA